MVKALLLHIGADQSNQMTLGINGPIFEDGTFEYIPIMEDWTIDGEDSYFVKEGDKTFLINKNGKRGVQSLTDEVRTYSNIGARNKCSSGMLSDYIPSQYENAIVHNDPDFSHFTYGDRIDDPRGNQIKELRQGDYLFFIASLAPYSKECKSKDRRLIRQFQKGKMAKYVIGYFKVQDVFLANKSKEKVELINIGQENLSSVDKKIDDNMWFRISQNAHTKRSDDKYFVVVGDKTESRLLNKAVKLTENGSPFNPTQIGIEIYGDVGFPRGFKTVYDADKIQKLLNYCT